MKKILLIACVLVLSSSANAGQLLENTTMTWGVDGWNIWSGEVLSHNAEEGHLSLDGAASASGQEAGVTAIAANCVDVSDWVYFAPFKAAGSIKPSTVAAENATVEVSVHQYSDIACGHEIGNETQSQPAVQDEWSAVSGSFSLVEGANSIRLILRSTGTGNDSVLFDDASLTIGRDSIELFDNPDLTENANGWLLYWGDVIEHKETSGHLTPGGSIRTEGQAVRTGSRGAFTGIRSLCFDISGRDPLDQFRVAASAKPDSDAIDPEMGIHVDYYSDTDCRSMIGRSLFFGDSVPSKWSRMDGKFTAPEGTRGIIVRVRSAGLAEGGGATFDDISLSLTPAVRQLWLVGVGDINDRTIGPSAMQYTRGGTFAGEFNPASVELEGLVDLEIEFSGCNTGQISYSGEDLEGSYTIYRLAQNEAVKACEESGYENVGENKAWMSGYWFGGPNMDGEGFAVDVLAGGEQAVITWYTYLPSWGVDAPR